jgi:hypothetical protein
MRGGSIRNPTVYTQETIKAEIEEYKKNKSWFADRAPEINEHGLDNIKTNDFEFYKNNLCVFVEFNRDITYDVDSMYLGKMTSSSEKFANFDTNDKNKLSFQCDLLYYHPAGESIELFNRTFKLDATSSQGVLIGFLPIEHKETVLSEAKKLRQL